MVNNTKSERGMTTKSLTSFWLITFGLTWGLAAMLLVFTDQIIAIFGEINSNNPLFILAVYSPCIAALLLVLWHYGLNGLGSFLKRLTLWRASGWWWAFLIVGIPAVVYIGAAIKGSIHDPFPFTSWQLLLPALAHALLLGPIEELGWRGVALPLLQRKYSPFWAGLILGFIWAAWHIPAFLMSGSPQSNWSFLPYFGGVVAISVLLTPFFNNSGGSLLIAMLYHFQMMNPLWPDAQPYDNYIYILLTVVVVWLTRKTIFDKNTGVIDVLFSE